MDKCDSHDDYFKRLYERGETVLDKLDGLKGDLHERQTDVNVRLVRLEMRFAGCEEQLRESASSKTDAGRKVTGMLVDLVKTAIIRLVGAAGWTLAHRYRG